MSQDRSITLKNYHTPVTDYPGKKLGVAEIKHVRVGRAARFAEGVRGKLYYNYEPPAVETVLKIRRRVWMTDAWPFVESLGSFAERSQGHVIVAGLGLGIVVHQLVRNPKVTRIDVIEREPDVIALVRPLLPDNPRINVHWFSDFYDWCETHPQRPDTVIWDLAVGTAAETMQAIRLAVPLTLAKLGCFAHKSKNFFVHGLDRDPVGEAFVCTPEFQRVQRAIVERTCQR